MAPKNVVKASKNDCFLNRYNCSLFRNKGRLSESQILVTLTKSFSCVLNNYTGIPLQKPLYPEKT